MQEILIIINTALALFTIYVLARRYKQGRSVSKKLLDKYDDL